MRRTFGKAVGGKGTPGRKTLRVLQKLAEQYPYSQPVRMAYARALVQRDKDRDGQEVNRAAACAPDRHMFRSFLSGKPASRGTLSSDGVPQYDRPGMEEKIPSSLRNTGRTSKQQEIIERFLKRQQRQLQRKAEDIPEGELSPGSIEDHPDLISETLADVLAKQGKTDKAAAIYEKLSLTFPEKSSYFAKKMESLK